MFEWFKIKKAKNHYKNFETDKACSVVYDFVVYKHMEREGTGFSIWSGDLSDMNKIVEAMKGVLNNIDSSNVKENEKMVYRFLIDELKKYENISSREDLSEVYMELATRLNSILFDEGHMSKFEFEKYKIIDMYDFTSKISEIELKRKKLELEKAHIDEFHPNKDEKEQRLEEIDSELLEIEFDNKEIDYIEYQKRLHSLTGEKWVRFTLSPDSDQDHPDLVEIDVEFNDEFVKWLRSKDVEYDPLKFESYQDMDTDSQEYKDLLIEGWVKNTVVRTAASFLSEDKEDSDKDGTFQSVLASSPEGTVVENVEIDKDSFEGTDEEFDKLVNMVKNKRLYK